MSTTPPNRNNPGQKPAQPIAPSSATGPQYVSPLAAKRPAARTGGDVPRGNQVFLFDKGNYMWMFIGLACILLGFVLMSGGKSPDPHVFNAKEVFSPMRITIAPLLILIGFGVEAYAIMKKPAVLREQA